MIKKLVLALVLALMPLNIQAAATLVQHKHIDSGPTTSTPLAFTSANTVGNFILVAVRAGGNGQTITVSDSRGNVYKKAFEHRETLDAAAVGLFYAENVAAGTNTVTVSDTVSGSLRIAIFEYSGIAPVQALDGTPTKAEGTSATLVSPALVTTSDEDLIIGVFSTASGTTINPVAPAVMQERVPSGSGAKLAVSDRTQATAGSISTMATISGSQAWFASATAFRTQEYAPPPATYSSHQWEWDQVVADETHGAAMGYRIYYTSVTCCSAGTCSWPTTQMIDIPADADHCGTLHCNSDTSCCGDFASEPPGVLVFFTVTAYNSAGESSTQHGAVVSTPCP